MKIAPKNLTSKKCKKKKSKKKHDSTQYGHNCI